MCENKKTKIKIFVKTTKMKNIVENFDFDRMQKTFAN